jgi:predicted RNase H-related nuclease YkuK (DUF458 family)
MKIIGLLFMFFMSSFANNSVYIWSKSFNSYANCEIIKFLKQHNINTALVSVSNNTDILKLSDFLSNAKQNNIKVEFLIGDNSWIYEDKIYKINIKLKLLETFNNYNIHLDIEPQAIQSLKHDREKYLKMYIEMLKYIHIYYPRYNISISIPTFYPVEYVKQISQYVDKIYLMAYEYKKLSQLEKRIKKYDEFKSQLVIAFNCKDFTKDSLQESINFVKSLGYKDIAFHSFKTLKELYETK